MYIAHNRWLAWVLALGVSPAWSASELPALSEGFLCCNMQRENDWISDNTLRSPTSFGVPAGTPIKALDVGRHHLKVLMAGKPMRLGNDYSRKLDLATFGSRYIVSRDPNELLAAWPAPVQEAVRNGQLIKGMSREQVTMAMGYPVHDATRDLSQPRWTFWIDSDQSFVVDFDADGHLANVEGPESALAMVMPSLLSPERLEAITTKERPCVINVYRPDRQPPSPGHRAYVYLDGQDLGVLNPGETLCLSPALGRRRFVIGIRSGWLLPIAMKGELTVEVAEAQPSVFLRYSQRFIGISGFGLYAAPIYRDEFFVANEERWRARD